MAEETESEPAWAIRLQTELLEERSARIDAEEKHERAMKELTGMAAKLGALKGRYRTISRLTRRILFLSSGENSTYDGDLAELRLILTADHENEQRNS